MFLDQLFISLNKNEERNAFCIKDKFYTYNDLKRRIIAIQYLMLNIKGIKENERFAVLCTDEFSTYAALLAIWFKGFSYVPLGMSNPDDRNISILKDADVSVILTTSSLDEEKYQDYQVVRIDNLSWEKNTISEVIFNKYINVALAYILFTSGSTGVPKGVPISYKNIDSFLTAFEKTPFKISQDDKCLQMFELTFDVSISSFLPALLEGACVYTVPNEVIKYIHVLKLIHKYELTVIQIVPSVIRLAMPLLGKSVFLSVKYCILTGEATNIDLLKVWEKCIPSAAIFNFYGPTEATIYCSYYACNSEIKKSYNGMLAIGKPFKKMDLIIVDEENKCLSTNEKGELMIRGDQLTTGYLNNANRNRSSFVTLNILGAKYTYYKSGDLCYKDNEDDIFYCGRIDNQVKINGFRVELSEIEACARNFTNLNTIVITNKLKSEILELILVLETENTVNETLILDHLKSKMPPYMMPSRIKKLSRFPLNSSGKTDRGQIKLLIDAA